MTGWEWVLFIAACLYGGCLIIGLARAWVDRRER